MPLLFGYGSLLSPASVSRTLGRTVGADELQPCTVSGFRRSWTAPVTVRLEATGRPVDALFLDLTPSSDACNGVLLHVTAEELVALDERERGYDRRLVTAHVDGRAVDAVAYIVAADSKARAGIVLRGYLRLVEDALRAYPADFRRTFQVTTDAPPEPLVDGRYEFLPREEAQ